MHNIWRLLQKPRKKCQPFINFLSSSHTKTLYKALLLYQPLIPSLYVRQTVMQIFLCLVSLWSLTAEYPNFLFFQFSNAKMHFCLKIIFSFYKISLLILFCSSTTFGLVFLVTNKCKKPETVLTQSIKTNTPNPIIPSMKYFKEIAAPPLSCREHDIYRRPGCHLPWTHLSKFF